MTIDYSSWDHIEISDDEDATHPNVNREDLFRARHERRLYEKRKREEQGASSSTIRETQIKPTTIPASRTSGNDSGTFSIPNGEGRGKVNQRSRTVQYWDVDNISRDGFDRTSINPNAKVIYHQQRDEASVGGPRSSITKTRQPGLDITPEAGDMLDVETILRARRQGTLSAEQANERLAQISSRMSALCDTYGEIPLLRDSYDFIVANRAVVSQESVEYLLHKATAMLVVSPTENTDRARLLVRQAVSLKHCLMLAKEGEADAPGLLFSKLKDEESWALREFLSDTKDHFTEILSVAKRHEQSDKARGRKETHITRVEDVSYGALIDMALQDAHVVGKDVWVWFGAWAWPVVVVVLALLAAWSAGVVYVLNMAINNDAS